MRPLFRLLVLLLAAGTVPAVAADITEKKALSLAVATLKGDPYGVTEAQVIANITERRHGPRSATVCGGGDSPVWAFRVQIAKPKNNEDNPIDGWLVLDGRTGRLVCANLPFID